MILDSFCLAFWTVNNSLNIRTAIINIRLCKMMLFDLIDYTSSSAGYLSRMNLLNSTGRVQRGLNTMKWLIIHAQIITTFWVSYLLSNLLISNFLFAGGIIISKVMVKSSGHNRLWLCYLILVWIGMAERRSILVITIDRKWVLFPHNLFKWNIVFGIVGIFCTVCMTIISLLIAFIIIYLFLLRFSIILLVCAILIPFVIVTLNRMWGKAGAREWIVWVHIHFISIG